jgi:hypothetical protein
MSQLEKVVAFALTWTDSARLSKLVRDEKIRAARVSGGGGYHKADPAGLGRNSIYSPHSCYLPNFLHRPAALGSRAKRTLLLGGTLVRYERTGERSMNAQLSVLSKLGPSRVQCGGSCPPVLKNIGDKSLKTLIWMGGRAV